MPNKHSLETSHNVQCHKVQTKNADSVWCHKGQEGKRGGNEGVKGVQSKGEREWESVNIITSYD